MRIEIAEPGRMTQTGKSLIKLIQNNNMPILDMIVRESIQNSLDAKKGNNSCVEVDYNTGVFRNHLLSKELEGITDSLNEKYGDEEYSFLSIRDCNTVGLTGVMNYKLVRENEYGNLLKLVYEICKPQDGHGAGGSWGIGKTVYFRVGIGLVIYYSRIYSAEEGRYTSRLAASLVEDESKKNTIIPEYKGLPKRGIAWWGDLIDDNQSQPVTDEDYIEKFIGIFGISPYRDKETGTTIIIPYINEKKLLLNNQIEYLDENGKKKTPYWYKSIEDYLKIAVQRWYAPRLNNPEYSYGAYLRVRINGTGISLDSMEPVFKVIQALYNRAYYCNKDEILADQDVKTERIQTKSILQEASAGVISFVKISKDILKMKAPDNKPEPYMYFNCEIRDTEINKPIICFTRQPGMIVSYECIGKWVANIPSCNSDEYIMGIFVLNSTNKLKDAPSEDSLEEYVRESEMADHTSWSDWTEGEYNPRIITRIQNGVNKIVSREFADIEQLSKPKVSSGLSKMFGEMLLPPEGFGKAPSSGSKKDPNPGIRQKEYTFFIEKKNIKYLPGEMLIPVVFQTNGTNKISAAGFEMAVDAESKKISLNEWESKMGLESPFTISYSEISLISMDGNKKNENTILAKKDAETKIGGMSVSRKRTPAGTCFGLNFAFADKHSFKIRMILYISLNRNDIRPSFMTGKEE